MKLGLQHKTAAFFLGILRAAVFLTVVVPVPAQAARTAATADRTASPSAPGSTSAAPPEGRTPAFPRMQDTGVKPPVRSEDGIFLHPNMESSVMISEQEQKLLADQRAGITRTDRKRAKEDKARRETYAGWENSIIASNYKQFKGVAEGEKSRHPSSGNKALERIQRIEKLKADILRFERYYDEDSEEVASLLSSLEEYYGELEGETYTANSFSGELIVRGLDYNAARDGWSVTVYSELFGLAGLFKFGGVAGYKDLIKKGGALQGLQGLQAFGGNEKDTSIHVIDSLFARTVPVLSASLEYRVIRGATASQYRLVPLSLTLARTDSFKTVISAARSNLAQGTFFMTPQLAVYSPADMALSAEAALNAVGNADGRNKGSSASTGTKSSRKSSGKDSKDTKDASGTSGSGTSGSGKSSGKSSSKNKKSGKGSSGGNKGSAGDSGGPAADSGRTGGSFTGMMLSPQKKRRALLVTVDTAVRDADGFDTSDLDLNTVKLNFEFANKDYFFYGGGLTWRYAGRNRESFYGAFVNGGANITLFRNFRPYVQLEASANTGAELGLGLGGGLDFTIKHLLLNLNAAYNWCFDADGKAGNKGSNFATFGFGLGFTW